MVRMNEYLGGKGGDLYVLEDCVEGNVFEAPDFDYLFDCCGVRIGFKESSKRGSYI